MENQKFLANDSIIVASLSGNLQGELAAKVREAMLTYIEDGYSSFRIDFSNVSNIDSTGLGILVTVQKRSIQQGGNIVLENLHGKVKATFERTRLSKAFTIADTKPAIA